jgi:hypothetical protein
LGVLGEHIASLKKETPMRTGTMTCTGRSSSEPADQLLERPLGLMTRSQNSPLRGSELAPAWAIGVALVIALLLSRPAAGAEGASSNYFPGSYGNLLPAAAPEPGFLLLSQNFFYAADTSRTLLQGRLNTELEVDAFFTLLHGYCVYELEALDARFLVGGNLALGYSSLDAAISRPGQPAVADDSSRVGLAQIGRKPASSK